MCVSCIICMLALGGLNEGTGYISYKRKGFSSEILMNNNGLAR